MLTKPGAHAAPAVGGNGVAGLIISRPPSRSAIHPSIRERLAAAERDTDARVIWPAQRAEAVADHAMCEHRSHQVHGHDVGHSTVVTVPVVQVIAPP
jgi:hypothetical protein